MPSSWYMDVNALLRKLVVELHELEQALMLGQYCEVERGHHSHCCYCGCCEGLEHQVQTSERQCLQTDRTEKCQGHNLWVTHVYAPKPLYVFSYNILVVNTLHLK